MSAVNVVRSMEQADLLVTVPLQKYSTLDYNKADAIIKLGYDAAASKASVLSAFSVSEAEWEEYLANRNARRRTAPIPQFVAGYWHLSCDGEGDGEADVVAGREAR